jgi:hypothetical protein
LEQVERPSLDAQPVRERRSAWRQGERRKVGAGLIELALSRGAPAIDSGPCGCHLGRRRIHLGLEELPAIHGAALLGRLGDHGRVRGSLGRLRLE